MLDTSEIFLGKNMGFLAAVSVGGAKWQLNNLSLCDQSIHYVYCLYVVPGHPDRSAIDWE